MKKIVRKIIKSLIILLILFSIVSTIIFTSISSSNEPRTWAPHNNGTFGFSEKHSSVWGHWMIMLYFLSAEILHRMEKTGYLPEYILKNKMA